MWSEWNTHFIPNTLFLKVLWFSRLNKRDFYAKSPHNSRITGLILITFYTGGPCLFPTAIFCTAVFIRGHQKLAFMNWKSRCNDRVSAPESLCYVFFPQLVTCASCKFYCCVLRQKDKFVMERLASYHSVIILRYQTF